MEACNSPALDVCFSSHTNRSKCRLDRKTRIVKLLRHRLKWWILGILLIISHEMGGIPFVSATQISENQSAVLDRKIPNYLNGSQFRRKLSQPFSASWSNVGIRSIIQRISSTQNISIILDRRIDPSMKPMLDLQNLTLEEGLQKIASLANSKATIVGSTVYIGPEKMSSKLKTLLELNKEELFERVNTQSDLKSRALLLNKKKSFHFQDLDRPSDILKNITNTYQITVKDIKLVPHDLWASGTLSAVNANEAISLVLIQYNLTYQWGKRGTQIQLVPIPDSVTIDKTYTPRGKSINSTLSLLKDQFPGLSMVQSGKSISINASIEQHEKIKRLLNPKMKSRTSEPRKIRSFPIQRRKFTLRVKKAPLNAIMNKLEQSGIEFQFNKSQLDDAGVDLSKQIDISVNQANAQEFFDALFGPVNLNYKINGSQITLTPK